MNRTTLLFFYIFPLILLIGILQIVAVRFDLYWIWSWFDILMHFLGGLWAGFLVLWLVFVSGYVRISLRAPSFLTLLRVSLVGTLIIGLGWELFEYVTGQTFALGGYVADTILDLIMDCVGAIVAATVAYVKCFKKSNSTPLGPIV